MPLMIFENCGLTMRSFLNWNNRNILLSSIRSLDEETVCIRFYNTTDKSQKTELVFNEKAELYISDLQEKINEPAINTDRLKVSLAPFEIMTILVKQRKEE